MAGEYKTAEVAKIAKTTKQSLYNWLRKKKIPEPTRDRNGFRIWTDNDLKIVLEFKNRRASL